MHPHEKASSSFAGDSGELKDAVSVSMEGIVGNSLYDQGVGGWGREG